jgi:hypothetical protein
MSEIVLSPGERAHIVILHPDATMSHIKIEVADTGGWKPHPSPEEILKMCGRDRAV